MVAVRQDNHYIVNTHPGLAAVVDVQHIGVAPGTMPGFAVQPGCGACDSRLETGRYGDPLTRRNVT
jgi:hypothetical protein